MRIKKILLDLWPVYFLAIIAITGFILNVSFNFLPGINNGLAYLAEIAMILGFLYLIFYLIRLETNYKVFRFIVTAGIFIVGGYILLLAHLWAVFSQVDASKLEYKGNTYYYYNTGFIDPEWSYFRQDGKYTMKELGPLNQEEKFTYPDEEYAKEIIDKVEKFNQDIKQP